METEGDFIRITIDDVQEANQLSLACPICVSPVENRADRPELTPVVCADCGTLYHRTCWQQSGGKCAILGCTSTKIKPYGTQEEVVTISITEVPTDAQVQQRNKHLKRIEREQRGTQPVQSPESRGFWSELFGNILKAFGLRQ